MALQGGYEGELLWGAVQCGRGLLPMAVYCVHIRCFSNGGLGVRFYSGSLL